MSRTGLALAFAVLLGPAQAGGQMEPCPGDCDGDGTVTVSELITAVNIALGTALLSACDAADVDGDGRVTVAELIAAVNAALLGCRGGDKRCPLDFHSDFQNTTMPAFCAFRGRWNRTCGDDQLEATFFAVRDPEGDITTAVVFTIPPVFFVGTIDSATTSSLLGVGLAQDPSTAEPIDGSMSLTDGGRTLVIDPDEAPFTVDDCPFERYAGMFTGIRTGPMATALGR